MNASTFPYLTHQSFEALESQAIDQAMVWFPNAAPALSIAKIALPLAHHMPGYAKILQHAFDEINALTGATVPS